MTPEEAGQLRKAVVNVAMATRTGLSFFYTLPVPLLLRELDLISKAVRDLRRK